MNQIPTPPTLQNDLFRGASNNQLLIQLPGGPDLEFDHVVIGAGVIGAATAYHLKRLSPDSRILLLDKDKRVGAGNTAKSAALYRNIFSSRASKMLSASSIKYYLTLGDKVQMNPIGYLWMFSNDQWKASKEAIGTLDPIRDDMELMDSKEIGKMLNVELSGKGRFPSVDFGIFGHLCGSLSGMGLAQHYASEFRERGGEISLETDIIDIVLRGKSTRHAPWGPKGIDHLLDRRDRTITGKNYIFATGAWTQDILGKIGIFTGVLPKKRQLFGIRIDDPGTVAGDIDLEKVPAMILPAGGMYIKPILHRKLMILGLAEGIGQPYDMSSPGFDIEYYQKGIEPVLNHYFPKLKDYDLKMKWAGYYSYHWPDKNPVVESEENITWASGTSGSGIMKADAVGRITAGKLLGRSSVKLFDGAIFNIDDLSLRQRNVEKERFVI
jgi:glycine/D-amino acid oxidase-like deaminating enzyme